MLSNPTCSTEVKLSAALNFTSLALFVFLSLLFPHLCFSSLFFLLPSITLLFNICTLFWSSLSVSASLLFPRDDAAPFYSPGDKIVHGGQQAFFGRQPSPFCFPDFSGLATISLQPGSNWA